ncbi:MAG: asparagine synthase (glutamine-hydrolyzing) [Defluviitaleaceae bacterium]|nr:asparagine synthase (glutamine-hydrolyzing) [Defluviitaleaceae bacterium]
MCGFCGFTGQIPNDTDNEIITKMIQRIAHRGPDGHGIHVAPKATLGFCRLSFLDLIEGGQPMHCKNSRLTIVFNGEIYNFKSLQKILTEKGHNFSTNSDTEVLIHLYEEYGEEMLCLLRGMFAFVIYDNLNGEIFAARDFFGIKPFYYTICNNNLIFASEIKSFLEYPGFTKKLNNKALSHYLSFQYSVLDETFFEGVFKLPPAHFLKWSCCGDISIQRYWQAEFISNENGEKKSLQDTISDIDNAIIDSVSHHLVSDVDIGCFLSSGVDSSYVASVLGGDKFSETSNEKNSKKTFTVGFDYAGYNEIEYAQNLSEIKGMKNHSKIITTQEYWESLGKIMYHMDEPLADPAAIALYFVSKIAREHVKGVLSGEGADELFGGYNIYQEPLDLKIVTILPMPIRRFLAKIASKLPKGIKGRNFFIRAGKTIEERFIGNAKIFTDEEREIILANPDNASTASVTAPYFNKISEYDDITKMQYLDIHLWLCGDILLKADKMSMANSLEVRVPFLDVNVFEIASKIPTQYRVNRKATKFAFRLAAKRHLDDRWANKKKLGFPVPVRVWLREQEYYDIVKEAFSKPYVSEFFKQDAIITLLERHKASKADNSRKIWTIYMFLLWYEEFFVKN